MVRQVDRAGSGLLCGGHLLDGHLLGGGGGILGYVRRGLSGGVLRRRRFDGRGGRMPHAASAAGQEHRGRQEAGRNGVQEDCGPDV